MDFEKVLPMKTVNDLMKELREEAEPEDNPITQCSCGHCTCGGQV